LIAGKMRSSAILPVPISPQPFFVVITSMYQSK
jgi:hypothetical protein